MGALLLLVEGAERGDGGGLEVGTLARGDGERDEVGNRALALVQEAADDCPDAIAD